MRLESIVRTLALTKKGLRRQLGGGLQSVSGSNACPDEEGIETSVVTGVTGRTGRVRTLALTKKGLRRILKAQYATT